MLPLVSRLKIVFYRLVAENVVLRKYNDSPIVFVECKNAYQLQLVTNYLDMHETNIMNAFCAGFGLVYSISYAPSIDGNNLSIIIEDDKH